MSAPSAPHIARGGVRRLAAAVALLAVAGGLPVFVWLLVGSPGAVVRELRATWLSGRVSDRGAVALGALVFTVLWAWFVVTALAEARRVLRWRRTGGAALTPATTSPAGWVQRLVRVALISSAAAVLAGLVGVRGGTRPAAAAGFATPAPVVSVLADPSGRPTPTPPSTASVVVAGPRDTPYAIARRLGDVTLRDAIVRMNAGRLLTDGRAWTGGVFPPGMEVLVPLPATAEPDGHVVVPGDCWWRIAAHHLRDARGEDAAPVEVLHEVERLRAWNAPRLGHRDPDLILPGEVVQWGEAVPLAPRPHPSAPPSRAEAGDVPHVDAGRPASVLVSPPTGPAAPLPAPAANAPAAQAPDRGDALPPSMGTAPADDPDGSPWRGALPVLAGTMCLGAVAVLEARRRLQLRRVPRTMRRAVYDERLARVERALRLATPADRAARLDLVVRAATRGLAATGHRVHAVVLHDDGAAEVVLDDVVPPSSPWRPAERPGAWMLDAAVDDAQLVDAARAEREPPPALVELGRLGTGAGTVFVDLVAIGVLCVEAQGRRAMTEPLLRALAADLALTRPGRVHVVAAGVPSIVDPELGSCVVAPDLAGALAAAALPGTAAAVVVHGGPPDPLDHDLPAWQAAAAARAVVCSRDLGGDAWVLRASRIAAVPAWRLEPLELDIVPVQLDVAAAGDVQLLLDAPAAPEAPPDLRPRSAPTLAPPALRAADPEPPWELRVRLLGRVAVERRDGVHALFARSKALELVAWIACHPERATRAGARAALWEAEVSTATFANVVSDARRALARCVEPAGGEEWLERTLNERLLLHPGVVTDEQLLRRRLAVARGLPARDAVAALRPGLELVTDLPFAGTGYLWPDGEGTTSSLVVLVTGAAAELAERYLELDDVEGVFWATGKGLLVLPGHEELIAIRMRAHARRGDLAGVRTEWDVYRRALEADAWIGAEPSPKLLAVREELLAAS